MKTKGFKLHGCLLLVCAIGLAVSIGTSIGNGKTPLSNEAMSNVFGGCGNTGPCDYDMSQGCNTPYGNTHCAARGVDPTTECTEPLFEQTCKRDQSQCKDEGDGPCENESHSCPTQVLKKQCYIEDGECCSPMGTGDDKDCDTTYSTFAYCNDDPS